MNEFKLNPNWRIYEHIPYIDIDIYIDGKNLIEIVREIELPYAELEGSPEIAGDYCSLTTYEIKSFEDFFLHTSKSPCHNWEETYLLECSGCRNWGCWALWTKIEVQENYVIWKNFKNHHRDFDAEDRCWKYDKMGPYYFFKDKYFQELKRAASQVVEIEKKKDEILPAIIKQYYKDIDPDFEEWKKAKNKVNKLIKSYIQMHPVDQESSKSKKNVMDIWRYIERRLKNE